MNVNKENTPIAELNETKRVKIRLSGDENVPWITGCVFMPDGRAAICDCNNNNVKLLAESLITVEESLALPGKPWDISAVSDKLAIITLPQKQQLQYVTMIPRLTNRRIIHLGARCWGVCVVGDYIYTTCQTVGLHGSEGEVRILDLEGNLKRRIAKSDQFWATKPYYITVSNKDNRMYVTDADTDTITHLDSDGRVILRYTPSRNMTRPLGICIDSDRNVLVCAQDSNNIHKIFISRDIHRKVILDSKDDNIRKPTAIAYRQTDKTMIIGCCDSSDIVVVNFRDMCS